MDLQNSGTDQNLDSLLDTMANVVGILVVVMAVAQITVGQAVQRIRASEEKLAESEAEASPEHLDALRTRWTEIAPRQWETERELERLRARAAAQASTEEPESDSGTSSRLNAQLASAELEARALEEEVTSKQSQLATLQIQLKSDDATAMPSAATLRLPDPRPAPARSTELGFGARYGHIVPLPQEDLEDELGRTIRELGATRNLSLQRTSDLSQIVRFFDVNPVGDELYRWALFDRGRGALFARLTWRNPEAGESWRELQREGARFRAALRRTTPARHFVKFRVWADSFQVYLAARRIAEEAGYSVGWEVFDDATEIEGYLTRREGRSPTAID